jgi:hypothetical protein
MKFNAIVSPRTAMTLKKMMDRKLQMDFSPIEV